jgi:protein TonB
MMIKTAGGPGMVHPIDFNERRRPRFSKATWIATGAVLAFHAALGAALYYQRFELPAAVERPQPPVVDIEFVRPKPPEPVKTIETPPAPNPPLNKTPIPLAPTETLAAVPTDKPTGDTTVLTFDKPVEAPQPESTAHEPAPTPVPPVIRYPTWDRQPTPEQMMRAYPPRAQTAGVSGSASLNCLVLPNGSVTDCNVTRETSGGYGFGRAAQSLSRYFRINPRTVDGAAEGSRVAISLRFTLPED